jgi:mono/diheme cytochrome c family protein
MIATLAFIGLMGRWSHRLGPSVIPAATGIVADPDIEDFQADAPVAEQSPAAFSPEVPSFLARHCVGCHGRERPKANIVLLVPDEAAAIADHTVWAKVAGAIRSGRMPPPERPHPDRSELSAFLGWVDQTLAGRKTPDRGNSCRVTLRRLNRTEYNSTIRDLVGVSFRPADDFPADDSGDGFDTIGDVLSISPTLMEKYLAAAEAVVEAAARDPKLWQKIANPPAEDFVPFVLRGPPPRRADAIKGSRLDAADPTTTAKAAEIDRAYYSLQAFCDRAYRRPVTHTEMYRLMRFVEGALSEGREADAGLKLAFQAVLISPHFLFKLEPDVQLSGQSADRRLNAFELASRLSYFLWSSMPDEELFRVAASAKLGDSRVLVGQVRRMLRDPKSIALARQFAGQWLQTRALADAAPDPTRFPQFDEELRQAMQIETELFFDHVVRDDQSVLDLLSGGYTFVNERLARHYGLAGVTGTDFRRVSLIGTGRGGVLTHASVLTVTSGPTRTSPVKRGKWILENLLGDPPPAPPPGADNLKNGGATTATLRMRMEFHRTRAECASCHARIDPLGFGLENFDALGAWRDMDANDPIDASGVLPSGRSFRGPIELRTVLAERSDDFVRCLTEKLATYALGRGLTGADRTAVDRIVQHAARNDYRFSSLVIALVRSNQFLTRGIRAGGAS